MVPHRTNVDSTLALAPRLTFKEFPAVFSLGGMTFQRLPADSEGHPVYVVVANSGDPYRWWNTNPMLY
jgi:hypothetical protein